ncbi:SAV_2336 family protein [Streptomyces sp. NBC_01210]|uniref:SAV_2336 N-terminal domain-related protein n=1 Tax=Streptomyces sp. NBC_01210 TaxID=2903774 RepID=UPI002E0E7101|nr:SAV_2336 family protein [Streptomyces sp. NBC_01210]
MWSELRRILADGGAELSHEELLDALWLAGRLPAGASSVLAEAGAVAEAPPSRQEASPGEDPLAGYRPPMLEEARSGMRTETDSRPPWAARPGEFHGSDVHAAPAGRLRPRRDRPAVPVRAPEEKALGSVELRLGRALRPLKQLRPDRREWELDEPATVTAMAETGLPDAVMRPGRARWLDLVLLVDDGVSMLLWQRLATETRLLMERSGAFRDVRVYGLDSRGTSAPLLGRRPYEQDSAPLPASAVTDPAGHTLLLAISDGVGVAWRDGRMHAALERAARVGPTAVLHALPERLWEGSGIRAEAWEVTTRRRGAPNHTWQVADPVLPPELAPYDGVPVPVLAPTPESLGVWARLVGSPGTSAVLPLLASRTPARPYAATRAPGGDGLLRFRNAASPQAYRLAAHLAAVAPVSVPAMRLVQAALGPEVDTGHLAEVFLGGLMRRTEGDDLLPQHRGFDFAEDTRRMLLDTLPAGDLVRTTRAVTARLAELADRSADFPAWLPHPSGTDRLPADGRPFGWMDERLLRRLGVPRAAAQPPAVPLPSFVDAPDSDWRSLKSSEPRMAGPFRLFARYLYGQRQLALYLGRSPQQPGTAVVRIPELTHDQAAALVTTEAEALSRMDSVYAPLLLGHDATSTPAWIATALAQDKRASGPAPNLGFVVEQRGALSGREFVSLGRQLTNGIARAHRKGVIHGSLIPEYIIAVGQEIEIIGWMAASLDGVHSPHRSILRHQADFRAPELRDPLATPTEASDAYALGRILLAVARGDMDYDPAAEPRSSHPGRDGVRALLRRCVTPDPADRPTADELLQAFNARAHEQPVAPLRATQLGLGEDGQAVLLDLNEPEYGGEGPYAWLTGPDVHERHRTLATIVRGLAEANPAESVSFLCAWHGDSEHLSALAELPQVKWAQDLTARPDSIGELHDLLRDELDERSWSLPLPRLVIVADDYNSIRFSDPVMDIAEALTMVRDQGIHVLVADEPDRVPEIDSAFTCHIELTGPRGHGLFHDGVSQPVPFRPRPLSAEEQAAELDAEHDRGVHQLRRREWAEAHAVLSSVASARLALLGPGHPATLMSQYEVGFALLGLDRFREALAQFQSVERGRSAASGPYHPDTLDARQQGACTLGLLGRHREALSLYNEVLARRMQVQGARHPDTLHCQHNVAFTLSALGRHREAYDLAGQVLTARIGVLGAEHPDALATRHEMAHFLLRMGERISALEMYNTVARSRARVLGADDPDTQAAQRDADRVRTQLGSPPSGQRPPRPKG